jgi:hypothetical protein
MPMSAKVTGFPELQGKARLLREAVRDRIAKDAVKAGAAVILEAMLEGARVAATAPTPESTAAAVGALRHGIRATSPRVDKLGFVSSLIGAAKRVAYLARWIEYGHRLVKGGKSRVGLKGKYEPGRQIGVVPAYPFLRPAYERTERASLDAFAETARTEMREVLR